MSTSVGPLLFTIFLWWFSTGAVLYAIGLPRYHLPAIISAASLAAVAALYGLSVTASDDTLAGAYGGFTCGLVIWGWHEMTFLTGLITGPRTTALPGREDEIGHRPAPFGAAVETVIYHEAAIALTIALAAILTWEAPNQTGLWTLVVLWLMRLSAKFNVYLGVPNLTEQFLPAHLTYLKGYFCRRPMNLLFPLSVTVSTVVTCFIVIAAADPAASEFETASLTFLATLMALAVLEHWFLVVPLPAAELWSWGLASRTTSPPRDTTPPTQSPPTAHQTPRPVQAAS